MKYIKEYISKYGDYDFIQKPPCEVDYLVFSQLIYNEFTGIINDGEKITLKEAGDKFYSSKTISEIDNLIDIAHRAAILLDLCRNTRRFGEIELKDYINNVNDTIDKQVAAVNFILPSGELVTAFRGTDATVAGFKESLMLAYMFPVPAQIEALHYFQETAMLNPGKVSICGHSKGGNLAVFAAVNCSNSLKKKLKDIYAFDAPGFPKWFFDRYDYKQVRDIIHNVNPQGSVIGRALASEKPAEIVLSDAKLSKQHNVSTWEIKNDGFVRVDSYTLESDKLSDYFNELVDEIGDDDLEEFYNALEKTATHMGISDFYDLQKLDVNVMKIILDSAQTISPEKKKHFISLASKIAADTAKGYVTEAVNEAAEKAKTKAKLYVKNVSSKIPFTRKNATKE